VIVEALLRGDELLDLGGGLLFEMQKRHDHVRHLHAGVVDVVLRFHVIAEPLRAANVRIAEDRIAEVTDVLGLVRIDVRVLHDHALA